MDKTETPKKYYKATESLIAFLKNIDGSYEQFARDTGLSARTIARMRNGRKINRETCNRVFKTACNLGFSETRDMAFKPIGREDHE